MKKTAILPGGFKPPHKGHYELALDLAKQSGANVVIRVGPAERDDVTQAMSIKIWEMYGFEAKEASSNSPIADVFEYVEKEATEGEEVHVGTGWKDYPRFKVLTDPLFKPENYEKYNPKGIKVVEHEITKKGGGINGNKMREFIKNDQKDLFQNNLPDNVDKDKIWNIVLDNIQEDLYDPNDHVLDYMKSSEWKAGMPDGHKDDIEPGYKYRRGGMYTGGGMGAGGMYEADEKGKALHAYDFDDTIAQVQANIRVTITSPKGDYEKVLDIPSDKFPEISKEMEAKFNMMNFDYNFSEFEKQIGDAIVNSKVLNKLKSSLSKPNVKTTILTARSIGHPVTRYLKSIGLDAYVVPLGLQVGGRVTGQDKADWIENHINKGYKTVYFIDDSEENRTAVSALKDKHPDVNLTVEDPAAVRETTYAGDGIDPSHTSGYGGHDLISQYKNKIKNPQEYRDLQLMVSQNKDAEAKRWLKVNGYMNETSVFSQNWWKEQLTEVITETKANTHLTHLEELVLTQGQDGFNQAKSFLYELIKNLKGEDNSIKNVSVKWDGAPAIFTGINPENGQFFVGTKSVFNVDPKINYTSQDIDTNHGHAGGLAKKLKLALEYLPAVGINGILQGDFMFDSDDVDTQNIEEKPHYTFRPNTIRYAVEANSDLGRKINAAKIGIIFHTTYKDLSGGGASFGADISGLNPSSNVWFDDAYFKDDTGILLNSEEESFVLEKIKEADSINVDYTNLPLKALNTYLNQEIRQGEFLLNPIKSFEKFKNWYQLAVDKSIEKVKRPETKEKKRKAGEDKIKEFESQKQDILNLFRISKLLSEAKSIFITKYDKAVSTKHFIDNGDGTLSVTKAEGFVAVDHTENGIKLVDRLEFSKNNFNAGKPGAKK